MEHDPQNDDDADIQAIRTAIELGVTHFDTAEAYASGYSEVLLGKAIKATERPKLTIISKVAGENLRYDDVINACKESLKRLQLDYLDVYLTHRFNVEIPVKETMRAMDTLMDEGLIRHIGVSNYNTEEMEEAQSYTNNKIVMNQLHYNLQVREVERKGILKYCQDNDMMLVAWRPVQKGAILGEQPKIVTELIEKYHKTASQIALNWLISQKNVVTLSKTRNIEHLKENLGAVDWAMEDDDIELLRNEFPDQLAVSPDVPLH